MRKTIVCPVCRGTGAFSALHTRGECRALLCGLCHGRSRIGIPGLVGLTRLLFWRSAGKEKRW